MNTKEGYDFLNSVRICENRIRRIKYMIAELRSCALPRSGQDDVPSRGTRTGSQTERIAERIVELEEELKEEIEKKSIALIELDLTLSRLPEGAEKTILYDCYVARIPMKKIARSVGYSLNHCYRLRKQGISLLEVRNETVNHNSDL